MNAKAPQSEKDPEPEEVSPEPVAEPEQLEEESPKLIPGPELEEISPEPSPNPYQSDDDLVDGDVDDLEDDEELDEAPRQDLKLPPLHAHGDMDCGLSKPG